MEKPPVLCGWCGLSGHILKTCPVFCVFKAFCSKDDYHDTLRSCDYAGFCSAGILITTKIRGETNILMIHEKRKGHDGFNLIGGKRDFWYETPMMTAMREFVEEVTDLSGESSFKLDRLGDLKESSCCWISQSKYVLFHLDAEADDLIGSTGEHGSELRWVPLWHIRSRKVSVHPFAMNMICSWFKK